MAERKLYAEIVKSGTWLYEGLAPSEVWIVKQNFEYHHEEGYSEEPEKLNEDGECFGVVIARNGKWERVHIMIDSGDMICRNMRSLLLGG